MKENKKRISKIVDELINYFFIIGANNLKIDIVDEGTRYKVSFFCNMKNIRRNEITKLAKYLSCEKLEEVEEYYWELTGECEEDATELSIVGMMIDDFDINAGDECLELNIYRNKT